MEYKQNHLHNETQDDRVLKRNGSYENVSFDKILRRIKRIGKEANIHINYTSLAMKVIDQLFDGISTTKIDELTAEQCASLSSTHPDYNTLAGHIVISNHQKNTKELFSEVMCDLYDFQDKHGKHFPLVSEDLWKVVQTHRNELDNLLEHKRDYLIDYFGFKTLERSYLMKINGKTVERPQHMWLRVSVGIHGDNLEKVSETYHLMSQKYFTHATPTLFNSGTPRPQLSSCFLLAMEDDSIMGIYNTLKDCALISKMAGGIGLHIHNVRATGSHIRGTNGTSNGIVPMLRVFNNTAKYVDQCVHPETIIYTTQGPKQIQNCTTRETSIFNMNGESEVIQNVLEHYYEGEILEIETTHSLFPLKITPMHPLYALKGQQKGLNYKVIANRIDKKICNFDWMDANDLTTDDMIVYPIPTQNIDIQNISEDDCYMYGVILGDGCMNNHDDTGYISMHSVNKLHIRNFVEKYFKEKIVDYKISINENTTRVRWNRTVHLQFRYNDFYDENKIKRIHHRWLNLPIEKSKYILKGLIDTDGCNDKELMFDNTSLNLIESFKFICLKMGVLTSGYIRDRIGEKHTTNYGIIEHKKLNYCLRIPKTKDICELMQIEYDEKQFFKFFRYNNFVLSRIQKINKKQYKGVLYDLQMEKQHDYLLENGLVHNGGGKRNGSFAIYLEPWHADIEMFLQMRKNHGDEELKARDLFYALWIPDLFMERVKNNKEWTLMCPDECPGLADCYGKAFVELYESYEKKGMGRKTVPARELWFKILDSQMETGTPYMCYKDAANKKSNQKNIGVIKSSNLCVAPETLLLTSQGHIPINQLVNQTIRVWNGEEFSEVVVKKTGEDQDVIDVYTDDGLKLTCTPYHKFYVQTSYILGSVKQVEAGKLQPGDKLIKSEYPIIDGSDSINIVEKYDVPSGNCSIKTKLEWFSRYCDDDGTIRNQQIQVASIHHDFLIKIKLMLQTCGINPKVKLSSERETSYLPDGKCGYNDYDVKPIYRLLISSYDLYKLMQIGFKTHRLIINDIKPQRNAKQFVKITKICNENRISDTYCFSEPKRHMGIFNGIITGQCTEIMEVSDDTQTAVCNLASIGLPTFVECCPTEHADSSYSVFMNYDKLHEVTKVVTRNLNNVIDINYYPTEKTKHSNIQHRPIGLGVQGLADVFMILGIAFDSEEARKINSRIFETIYHASLEASCELAMEQGPYTSFAGSPASQGILQFDLWNFQQNNEHYDWDLLKSNIQTHGLRNSLLLAPMPTASTSQILGFNECIEPITSNIYSRRTNAGEFIMTNKYLMKDLMKLDLWNEKIKNNIIANNGSIQHLDIIPQEIRDKYKTVWEIPMRSLIDMAADRGVYICQSQSLNLWLEDPNYSSLTSMHFHAWSKGLKTGIYYLRRRARHQAQQFTIEPEKTKLNGNYQEEDNICEMCSS